MPKISMGTAVIAIQAVHDWHQKLAETIREAGEDCDPEDQLMLLSIWKAAAEMKAAYLSEWKEGTNAPKYAQLVDPTEDPVGD